MSRARGALLTALAALPLAGCAVAAVPLAAGTAVAATEQRPDKEPSSSQQAGPETPATVQTEALLPPEFAALVSHVRQRAALWREGAPINSLVLDSRQTVLNPVAIGCARRDPLVIIDIDPAPTAGPTDAATLGHWRQAAASIRSEGVGLLWVTDRPDTDIALLRPALMSAGLEPADTVAGRTSAADRKQLIRQRWAQTHCILAVVGDARGDADEAYDYLRSIDVVLPIDSNWGAGWFLLPVPTLAIGGD
jgi:hypothetical protein